jgi:hypothetical protein
MWVRSNKINTELEADVLCSFSHAWYELNRILCWALIEQDNWVGRRTKGIQQPKVMWTEQ